MIGEYSVIRVNIFKRPTCRSNKCRQEKKNLNPEGYTYCSTIIIPKICCWGSCLLIDLDREDPSRNTWVLKIIHCKLRSIKNVIEKENANSSYCNMKKRLANGTPSKGPNETHTKENSKKSDYKSIKFPL